MLISVRMAMESLKEQVDALEEAEALVARRREDRDRLIRQARESKMGYATLAKVTGLSRHRLYSIVNSPPRDVSLGEEDE